MKRTLALMLCLLMCISLFASCGSGSDNTPKDTATQNSDTDTKDPGNSETEKTDSSDWPEDTEKFSHFEVFKAPTGNPRDIVMEHMMKMATYEWTPAEDFAIKWEGSPSFDPNMNLKFIKGKKYTGTTYGNTHCTFELFTHFLNEKNEFKYDNYSYEKIIGNNCSTTMTLSYQQIIDLPISVLKPISTREGLLQLAGSLKKPEGLGDQWYSEDVFAANSQSEVYNAYTTLDKGDILYKSIKGTGHTRMVVKSEPSYTVAGKLVPNKSYVYVVESTNAWFDETESSLWYINKKYTYSELYETLFMPVTLCIYHEENPVYKDAYIAYEGTMTADILKAGFITGTVTSNFPINYVMATVTDTDGNVVARAIEPGMTTVYKYDLRKLYLSTSDLPAGNYTLTVRAGIARGGTDIITLDFSK